MATKKTARKTTSKPAATAWSVVGSGGPFAPSVGPESDAIKALATLWLA